MAEARKPETTGDLEKQIKAIREDMAKLASLVAAHADATISQSAKAALTEAEELLKSTRQATGAAAKKTKDAVDSVEAHIAEKPVQSVLVALLVGFFVGALSRR